METTIQAPGIDSLASLEERITRAVQLITDLRTQNAALTKRVATLEDELRGAGVIRDELESANAHLLKERGDLAQKAQQQAHELDEARGERKEVRSRIEKLLSQLDLLSAS
jgi:chromosome segregation ATPase